MVHLVELYVEIDVYTRIELSYEKPRYRLPAARILGIELTPARQAEYDAIERIGRATKKLQIKGRCFQENCKPGQRLGSIRTEHDWDLVLMVLLDHEFNALEISRRKGP